MVMRKWLLSTVVSSGIFLAAGYSQAAQTEQVLQPDGGWSVSRVAAASSGDSYCTMARKYDQNIILTIARNSSDETSVAMDFQKEFLKKGENYNIALRAGPGQERSYDVRPISDKAVVLRLGKDYAFHDALVRSASLAIDIGDQTYNFSMPDIDHGQSEIRGCLATLVEPAAGDGADTAPVPEVNAPNEEAAPQGVVSAAIPAEEIVREKVKEKVVEQARETAQEEVVQEKVAVSVASEDVSASREVDALREENERLRGALERERRDFENRFMQQNDSSSLAAELNEKIRLLEIDNNELKYELSNLPAPAAVACPAPDSKATESMANELSMLRDENVKLKNDIGSKQGSTNSSSQEMTGELAALRSDNSKLRGEVEALNVKLAELDSKAAEALSSAASKERELDSNTVATIGRLQGRVEVLEAENAGLKESLRTAQDQVASATAKTQEPVITLSQLRSIEEQLKMAEAERDRLRTQIENVQSGKEETVIGSIAGNNWDLEQATRRFNEAEREIRRLGTQIEQQRSQCAAEKKEIEYMLFDPEIATQEQIAKLTALEQELAQAKAKGETGNTGYIQKISELQAEIALKDAELSTLRSREVSAQQVSAPVAPEGYTSAPLKPQSARYDDSRRTDTTAVINANQVSKPVAIPVLQQEASALESSILAEIKPASGGDAVTNSVRQSEDAGAVVSIGKKFSDKELSAFISASGIEVKGAIKREGSVTGTGADAYSWETGSGLFGSAEVRTMASGESFDDLTARYLSRTQGRCTGEFASVPVLDAGQGGHAPVKAFEVACLGEGANASASVVFFVRDGEFIAIAHEAPLEGMDMAMDARDRIVAAARQDKLASN